ncbi:MAG: AAA family ATPase [Acholeplasmatales bacterium]|jgi:ABC-2 type transport system ATP-binding protein|nr:AAA family ATPase [Acholeplasmatales bacterium]
MIEFVNVSKKYLTRAHSFIIQNPSIFCLIGPNASGKTTILKMLCGLKKPSQGEINRHGLTLAYTSDNPSFPNDLNGYHYLKNLCKARKVPYDASLANAFNLDLFQKIAALSKGSKQKLAIITTLLSDKDIYVFDEPFNALDRRSSIHFVKLLKQYKAQNKTLILSTHSFKYLKKVVDYWYQL